MNIVSIRYDSSKDVYAYDMNSNSSPNCKIYDYDSFEEVELHNQFILFIGCIYYGSDVGIANSLAEMSSKHLKINFYFKFIFRETELGKVAPKELERPQIPIIIYANHARVSILSNGPILRDLLDKKIQVALNGN